MSTMEGSFLVGFVYDRPAEDVFDDITDAVEPLNDVTYQNITSGTLKTESYSYSFRTTNGLYPEDREVIQLGLKPGRLVNAGEQYLTDTLEVVELLYGLSDPVYVYGMHSGSMDVVGMEYEKPVTPETLAANRLNYPSWLMLFPPVMVEEYGRGWLLDLPVDRVEELDDGAILVVAKDDFTDCEIEADMMNQLYEMYQSLESVFDRQ